MENGAPGRPVSEPCAARRALVLAPGGDDIMLRAVRRPAGGPHGLYWHRFIAIK